MTENDVVQTKFIKKIKKSSYKPNQGKPTKFIMKP